MLWWVLSEKSESRPSELSEWLCGIMSGDGPADDDCCWSESTEARVLLLALQLPLDDWPSSAPPPPFLAAVRADVSRNFTATVMAPELVEIGSSEARFFFSLPPVHVAFSVTLPASFFAAAPSPAAAAAASFLLDDFLRNFQSRPSRLKFMAS